MIEIVTDASWKNNRAGVGLVISGLAEGTQTRSYAFTCKTSMDAEYEGVARALDLLGSLRRDGRVWNDCSTAVVEWQGRIRDEGKAHLYTVEFMRDQERDDRYHLAHRLSVRARENGGSVSPLAIRARAPRAEAKVKVQRCVVVIDDVHNYHDLALYFVRLPDAVTPSVYNISLANGQACFVTFLQEHEQEVLAASILEEKIPATVYVQS